MFDHPRGTRNVNINSKKRKSEVINSESTLEYKSSKNKSGFDSFGVFAVNDVNDFSQFPDFLFEFFRNTTQNFTAIGI